MVMIPPHIGNENRGVSRGASAAADGSLIIPMMGMTQSFNISVTCALVIQHLQQRGILHEKISSEEQIELLAKWLINVRDVLYPTMYISCHMSYVHDGAVIIML
jgi:tRNA (guanosine-2'-O-)-methyltransferase